MNLLLMKAAVNIAGEPVSIEPDGTVWADSDGRIIDGDSIAAEVARLEQEAANAEAARVAALESARAKLAALGLSDSEVAAVMGVQL